MTQERLRSVTLALLAAALAAFLLVPQAFEPLLRPLAPQGAPAVYAMTPLGRLALSHLGVTALATLAATVVAVALAVLATRPSGRGFLPLARGLANAGQTLPPIVVLAVATPAVGFGAAPTLIALFLYGLLPVFENALAGLEGAPPAALDAARGVGMTPGEALREVELPLALPAILTGVRLSAVIALSTAALGSTVGASTLGEVVIAGLASDNLAFVVQGAAAIAALALLVSAALAALERAARRRSGIV